MPECNQLFCHWVQDAHDPNRYTCLKCGRKVRVNNFNWGSLAEVVLQIIGGVFLVVVLLGCDASYELATKNDDPLIDPPKRLETNN